MPNLKVSELTAFTKIVPEDIAHVVTDVSGTPLNQKGSFGTFLKTYNRSAGEISAGLSNDDLDFTNDHGHPLRYGAVGDGVANDTTAISNAFSIDQKIIGDGLTYLVTAPLIVKGSIDNATFKITAPSTPAVDHGIEIQKTNGRYNNVRVEGTSGYIIAAVVVNANGVIFNDCEIDFTGTGFGGGATTGYGLRIQSNDTVDDLQFIGGSISINTNDRSTGYIGRATNVIFRGTVFHDIQSTNNTNLNHCIYFDLESVGSKVYNCAFTDNNVIALHCNIVSQTSADKERIFSGLYIYKTLASSGQSIFINDTTDMVLEGVTLVESGSVTIADTIKSVLHDIKFIKSTAANGIVVADQAASAANPHISDISFSGCTLTGFYIATEVITGGVFANIKQTNSSAAADSHFKTDDGHISGLALNRQVRVTGDDNTFMGNDIDVTGMQTLRIAGDRNRVFHNELDSDASTNIFIASGSDNEIKHNNIITTGTEISDSGTDTIIANNTPLGVRTFTSTDATPFVGGGGKFKTAGTTAITDFDGGQIGDTLEILATASITITDGSPIILNGSANFDMTDTDTLRLTMFNDQVWQEVSRSVN